MQCFSFQWPGRSYCIQQNRKVLEVLGRVVEQIYVHVGVYGMDMLKVGGRCTVIMKYGCGFSVL